MNNQIKSLFYWWFASDLLVIAYLLDLWSLEILGLLLYYPHRELLSLHCIPGQFAVAVIQTELFDLEFAILSAFFSFVEFLQNRKGENGVMVPKFLKCRFFISLDSSWVGRSSEHWTIVKNCVSGSTLQESLMFICTPMYSQASTYKLLWKWIIDQCLFFFFFPNENYAASWEFVCLRVGTVLRTIILRIRESIVSVQQKHQLNPFSKIGIFF